MFKIGDIAAGHPVQVPHDRQEKMKPGKRDCVSNCNFAAYHDSQIGRGVRNIASYSGKPFRRGFLVNDIQIYHGRPYQRVHGIGTVFRRI